jgi:leucyl-tRNA synthetase
MDQREPHQTITGPAVALDGQPPFRYDARLANEIEARWQRRWAEQGTFNSPNPAGPLSGNFAAMAGRPKFYVLDMFPYPSGAGLHVGHPLGYIGTDVFARYLRMTGHHVLHTFGYDAFGLPAEQYAIETGQHPRVTTRENIANMRRQLRRLGLGHDPRREIATTDVSFYRWTQWIFLQLFNSWVDERTGRARPIGDLIAEFSSGARATPDGRAWQDLTEPERHQVLAGRRLAYRATETVNWCPGLGTVLANEEVTADGRSDIGNYPVYRRPLEQWMLRITAFADRLVADLDLVDWPEPIKQMQRNWIGTSDGASIEFPVTGRPDLRIEVFTTRPDTISGATYLVLAPEHPLAPELVAPAWPDGTPAAWRYPGSGAEADWTPAQAVAAYQDMAGRLSDRQRTESYDKTGVFTGGYAENPATGERLPVFLADYVLTGYGTGAIMAVPAHDGRDLDFARRFGLPVRAVLAPPADWRDGHGIDQETPAGQWPEAFTGDGDYLPGPGPQLAGLSKPEAVAATIAWLEARGAGHGARSYRLRDWLFSRQRYWGEPFPIVYDSRGLAFALPEAALPVRLPDLADIRPEPAGGAEGRHGEAAGTPVPPLARAHDWASVELDLGDGRQRYQRELNTMPQWAGSCWYYLRYLDPDNEQAFVDPQVERYWMRPPGDAPPGTGGVDLYVGGVEHAVLHLLYARFWHKVLYDLGHVSSREPFRRLFNQGYILADAFTDARGMYVPAAQVTEDAGGTPGYQGQPVTRRAGKMGKSLKNGVSPDDIYADYGADTLRLYEMAMGPLGADRPWRTGDIVGVYRFLQRLWRSMIDEETGEVRAGGQAPGEQTLRLLHRTIMVVRRDFEQLRYNTAIARLMELTSQAAKIATSGQEVPRAVAEPLVLMVAPLAPHIAEELWHRLGHAESLAYHPFPEADPELAAERSVEIPVQVNGKTRFTIAVPADADEGEIEKLVTGHADYAHHTADTTVRRLVIVRQRIVNVVTAK